MSHYLILLRMINEYKRINERIYADFLHYYANILVDHFKLIYK